MSEPLAKGLLSRQRRLHFIGVGGAGMSGIAELSLRLGFAVSGCDQRLGATTERLAALGVQIFQGHHPEHIADHIADRVASGITQRLDAVVISSAVKFSNPEVARARALQIPVIARAEMLGELLRMVRLGVAVAGTHGKTTTTSLVGLILEEAGLDPTVAIGGNLRARGTNVRLGGGDYMVAEADESDASFLLLLPTIAVVTNIDPEHLDHYGTMERVREAYLNFINRVPFYGLAVLGIDSVNVRGLLASVRKPMLTYGVAHDAELRAENIVIDGLSTRFTVIRAGRELGVVEVPTPGRHVALNALAAVGVALAVGIEFEVSGARAVRVFGHQSAFRDQGRGGGPDRARRLRASSGGSPRDAGRGARGLQAAHRGGLPAPSLHPAARPVRRFSRRLRRRRRALSLRRLFGGRGAAGRGLGAPALRSAARARPSRRALSRRRTGSGGADCRRHDGG